VPSSYTLYQMTAFPRVDVGGVIAAPQQLAMHFSGDAIDEPPRTELKFHRTIEILHMDVFRGLHEFIVRKSGRAWGVRFNLFIAAMRFPAYYERTQKLLMLKVPKKVAHGAMRQLVKNHAVDGQHRNIDLDSIKPYIERFKGVWFSVDDSAYVTSQALFGPSVDQDLRFERASGEGKMFSIRLDHEFRSELIHIGISSDSNVVVYDESLDEHLELELVLDIKARLLDMAKDKE